MKKKTQPENELLQATALKYDAAQDKVPYVIGVGQGLVAENMVKKAQDNDIPVVEDHQIAQALQKLGVGDEIPEELYQVIAEVLVFIARLDGDQGARFGMDDVAQQY